MQAEREEAALQRVAEQRGNLFAELMSAVKLDSLGQISGALYEVGGIYRRNIVDRHQCGSAFMPTSTCPVADADFNAAVAVNGDPQCAGPVPGKPVLRFPGS